MMNEMTTALQILRQLLAKGQIDRETESDLFLEFRNPEVRTILAQMEEELEFKIVEASGTFYLVPDSSNSLLGFSGRDLREWVASDARLVDAYLLSYIAMVLLHLFYGGRNQNPKQREFLRMGKLIEELDQRFDQVTDDPEHALILEDKYVLNFLRLAELWKSKQGYEEKGRKTKVGTALQVCRLFERENLLRILDNDREIRPTRKLDDLMLNYYLNDSRVEEINTLLGGADPNASN